MNTVCNCSHDAGSTYVSSLFFSYLNFILISVDNICHSQNVPSHCNETSTVTCSHSAETVISTQENKHGIGPVRNKIETAHGL